ncbi:hypothetical protein M8C21_002117 [Ambrosia artemisiifolia]|uniref:HTH La-type RNA-binding domain-containing protein n=1 Tax=Ambrosia artemisiifolia TaxID=4212 RepID=A0AAD5BQ62_AMBAR|nr:hypothetical protein M8C21_002117 [Ambrosia artemisiifolia]
MTADSSTATVTFSGDDDVSAVTSATDRTTVTPPSPVENQPEGCNDCNGGDVLKSVWNIKPLDNGVVEGVGSTVMGADSWPALSESTRFGAKSASGSEAVSQAPVISQPPQKQVKPSSNSNNHHNPNNGRQRAMKRGGSVGVGGGASNRPTGPPTPPPLPPPFPVFDVYGNLVPAGTEFPRPGGPPFKSNNWSPRYDRTSNRNPARRNNFGPRPFGYGGRRDHNGPRGAGTRDVHMPHQMGPPPHVRGFVRPPFIPQPLRPYGAPMGYEMGASYVYVPAVGPELYRGGAPVFPHGASGSAMFISYWDSSLHDSILRQIEYYFSDENLVKDNFLRSHMDDEGWVSISLIAGFQRVQKLTNDVQMILSSLAYSNTVEVQGVKVRRRTDWRRWIHIPRETTGEEASLQKLTLEDEPANEKQVLANGDESMTAMTTRVPEVTLSSI